MGIFPSIRRGFDRSIAAFRSKLKPSKTADLQRNPSEPLPLEKLFFPDLKWTVIDIPARNRGEDFHTEGIGKNTKGTKNAVVVVADSADKTGLPLARKYSHEVAGKLSTGTPLLDLENRNKQQLKPFAMTATRINYPDEQKKDYTIENLTHRDCFTVVWLPHKSDSGNTVWLTYEFPLSNKGLVASKSLDIPPGSIIITGSDGGFDYLLSYTIDLYNKELKKKLPDQVTSLYTGTLDKLYTIQKKFQMGGETELDYQADTEKIFQAFTELSLIDSPLPGQEELFFQKIENAIKAMVEQNGGYPTDDLTLLLTCLPSAQKETAIKEEKPKSLEEIRAEMVKEIEMMLKDEKRSPTADGSAITGYHRDGDASLQCSHVWYGRDSRMVDIVGNETAMVEGVTINLNGMFNYSFEEFARVEEQPAPSNQRTYFIPINPNYPVIVEHPSFIQRQSEHTPERELKRVLPDEFVNQELNSPVPYRRATDQDIKDAHVVYCYTIGMANRAMNPEINAED